MPWEAICRRPELAMTSAKLTGTPPLPRISALFWKTRRYRRGPSPPSMGGSRSTAVRSDASPEAMSPTRATYSS